MQSAILVTSGGSKVPLIKAVKDAAVRTADNPTVISADTNSTALCQYFSDDFWVMKLLSEYEDDELIHELTKKGISYVIPTRDGELLRWAQLKTKLDAVGIRVLVSDVNVLEYVMDKLLFAKWLEENGFESIKTLETPNFRGMKKLVIKERYASSAKNTVIGINLEDADELSRNHTSPIFQEFVEGKEFSVDVWIHESGRTTCLARTRDVIMNGESRVTTHFPSTELEEFSLELARKLNIQGPSVFQFIQNSLGQFIPIECNARIGGASTFSITTKFDSIYVSLCEHLDEPLTNLSFPSRVSKQVRVMKDYYFI